MLLGRGLEVVLKGAVVELHRAKGLGDERVVVLVRAGLDQGDVERGVVFLESGGNDTACQATADDEVVGHVSVILRATADRGFAAALKAEDTENETEILLEYRTRKERLPHSAYRAISSP